MRPAVLLLLLVLTACTGREPEAGVPPSAPPDSPTAMPVTDTPPDDHELGEALPGPGQIGIRGFTSCISGTTTCVWPESGNPDPTLSWARAGENGLYPPYPPWADVRVSRQQDPRYRRQFLNDAKILCTPGDWSLAADPRGFHPRPPLEGTSQRIPVDWEGFRGMRCATNLGVTGSGERHDEHWIRAVRDDVQLMVSASTEALVLRLFEEYVDRLDWPLS